MTPVQETCGSRPGCSHHELAMDVIVMVVRQGRHRSSGLLHRSQSHTCQTSVLNRIEDYLCYDAGGKRPLVTFLYPSISHRDIFAYRQLLRAACCDAKQSTLHRPGRHRCIRSTAQGRHSTPLFAARSTTSNAQVTPQRPSAASMSKLPQKKLVIATTLSGYPLTAPF